MNTNYQVEMQESKPRVPLFASTWVALFFVLRHEFSQSRSGVK